MNNSKFAPFAKTQYSSKDLNAAFRGTLFSAVAGETTTYDLLVSDDVLIDGALFVAIGGALGDKATFQVIDKDNVLGFGTNVVLGQYATDWYINPEQSVQLNFDSAYPAKVLAGIYLRIIYTSVGENNVDVIVNYKLHKVLW